MANGSESGTYWTSDERDEDDDDLLPWCERTQVDRYKSSTCDTADAHKECVNVFDVKCTIRCREYARGNNWRECTDPER